MSSRRAISLLLSPSSR